MAQGNGGAAHKSGAHLLLALFPRPQLRNTQGAHVLEHPLIQSAAFHVSELQRRLDAALSTLPPQIKAFLPHHLHSTARQVTARVRMFTPLRTHSFAAIIPGDSLAELVVTRGLTNFFSLYNAVLIVRIICTWFPDAPRAIVNPISTVTDPYLNLFRGIIPPLGGTLDFSPILAFLLLDAFSNAATALPAELPNTEATTTNTSAKWRQRTNVKNHSERKNSP